MTSPPLAVVIEPGPRRMLARVCGEIDTDNAHELRRTLVAALDSSARGLDIDLSGVTFCDCTALHVLLHLNQLAQQAGKTLVLSALGPRTARLLQITRTHHVFTTPAHVPRVGAGTDAPTPRGRQIPGLQRPPGRE
ncbi:STAS domain-containing protein [Streptomyces sp. CB02009]|uniref:STAS domain-containing protein n=1 Tax=Streptomyces sp. CB02009 TaxID=1703938 RepID=UPI00130180EE|nr:STAS domain-containing protein [Streptomyces sp. CB02009]